MNETTPKHAQSKQSSVLLTAEMRQDIESLGRAKYGPRGLSKWIEKAIANFMKKPDFVLRVGVGEAKMELSTRKVITLTPDADEMLNDAVTKVRRADPTQENVRAMILRSAFNDAIREAKLTEPALVPSAKAKVAEMGAPKISDKAPGMRRKAAKKASSE